MRRKDKGKRGRFNEDVKKGMVGRKKVGEKGRSPSEEVMNWEGACVGQGPRRNNARC